MSLIYYAFLSTTLSWIKKKVPVFWNFKISNKIMGQMFIICYMNILVYFEICFKKMNHKKVNYMNLF